MLPVANGSPRYRTPTGARPAARPLAAASESGPVGATTASTTRAAGRFSNRENEADTPKQNLNTSICYTSPMGVSDDYFDPGGRTPITDGRGQREVFTRSGDDTDLDTVFDLLGDQRRRLLLRFFYVNQFEAAAFDEVVSYIRRWESRMDRRSPPEGDVELSLVHNHLPRLESAGIVEVDRPTATIEYNGSESLERILAAAIDTSAIP